MKKKLENEGISIRALIWALIAGLIMFNGLTTLNIMVKIGMMLAIYLIADSRIANKENKRNRRE